MKKFKILTMSAMLTITSLGLFSPEDANASSLDESIVNVPVLEAPISNEPVLEEPVLEGLISPMSAQGSGWQTKGGIKAQVYNSKDSYNIGERIKVYAERSGTGATVYYDVRIGKMINGSWVQTPDSGKTGTFTSKVHNFDFNNYGSGLYKVLFKVFSDSSYNNWIGDWETTFYVN